MRTHSSVRTTIAPASRSSATAGRLARIVAACSAARRPTRRLISRTDGSLAPLRERAEVGVGRDHDTLLRLRRGQDNLIGCGL
jgi:hypothetical protein